MSNNAEFAVNSVHLSFSSQNLSTSKTKIIRGALAYVERSDGTKYPLIENPSDRIDLFGDWGTGKYIDTSGTLVAELGYSYRLHVVINNKTYESNFEQMSPQSPIDSAWAQNKHTYQHHEHVKHFEGEFFLMVNYKKLDIINNYSIWSTNSIDLIVDDDSFFGVDSLKGRPFFNYTYNKEDFGLILTRESLNRNAYEYWSNVIQQLNSKGSPFDSPPAPMPTNIHNVNDLQDQVFRIFYRESSG